MSEQRVEQPKPPGPYPRCSTCNEIVRVFMARTDRNYGRWFYKCGNEHKNNFFWADEYHEPEAAGGGTPYGDHHQPPPIQYGSPPYGGQGPYQAQPQPQPPATPEGHAPPQQHGNPYSPPQPLQPPPTPQAQPHVPRSGVTVQVQVLGPGDIGFSTLAYNETFKDIMKQLPGRQYVPKGTYWQIKSHLYPQAHDLLTRAGFIVEDAPPQVISALVKRNSPFNPPLTREEANKVVGQRVDPQLWSRLFRYQREGVLAGVRFDGRVLLADEMGLGKTVQALTIMSCFPEDWPLLVICPTSLRHTWESAVRQWLPEPLCPAPPDLWLIAANADWDKLAARTDTASYGYGSLHKPHVAIVSYDLAAKIPPQHAKRYRSFICDESHSLKNRSTKRVQRAGPLLQSGRRVVMCTGTPLLNRPIEIWPQVDLLRPGLLGSFDAFGERYCLTKQALQARQHDQQGRLHGWGGGGGGGWRQQHPGAMYQGSHNPGELHALLTECVMVRRLKKDVLTDLPPKIRTKVTLEPSDADLQPVAAELRRLKEVQAAAARGEIAGPEAERERQQAWTAAYTATGPAKVAEAIVFLDRLLQIEPDLEPEEAEEEGGGAAGGGGRPSGAGGRGRGRGAAGKGQPPAPAADAEADDDQEEGQGKVLVFANHMEVLGRLEAHLKAKHVRHIRIDGSVPADQRQKRVEAFQAVGPRTPRAALLSMHAAGAGLTLTAASTVVFAELDHTPAFLAQAEDRAHRVGQGRHVHVYYLMGKGTLDEQIWAMLETKKFMTGAILDGEAVGSQEQPQSQQHQAQQAHQQQPAADGDAGGHVPSYGAYGGTQGGPPPAAGGDGAYDAMGAADAAAAAAQRQQPSQSPAAPAPRTADRTADTRKRPLWAALEDDDEYDNTMPFASYRQGGPPPPAPASQQHPTQQQQGSQQHSAGAGAQPFDWRQAIGGLPSAPPPPAAALPRQPPGGGTPSQQGATGANNPGPTLGFGSRLDVDPEFVGGGSQHSTSNRAPAGGAAAAAAGVGVGGSGGGGGRDGSGGVSADDGDGDDGGGGGGEAAAAEAAAAAATKQPTLVLRGGAASVSYGSGGGGGGGGSHPLQQSGQSPQHPHLPHHWDQGSPMVDLTQSDGEEQRGEKATAAAAAGRGGGSGKRRLPKLGGGGSGGGSGGDSAADAEGLGGNGGAARQGKKAAASEPIEID